MKRAVGGKMKLIISFESLSDELKEMFREEYSNGYNEYIQKIIKPNGEPIFVVPFETETTSYMVKFEVTIDSKVSNDDLEKDIEELSKDEEEEISVELDSLDEGKDSGHKEFDLKHGDYNETNEDEDNEDEDDGGDEAND